MPVAALTTLGCKVNQYETERIAEDFARAGFQLADFDAPADVYVINSCSVTSAADRKSRYLARKAARANPDALVVMTGCHSQTVLDSGQWVEGATLLIPNHEKMQLFQAVLDRRPELLAYSSSPAAAPPRVRRKRQTLKIQDGCTHFCGFCQIPYTRKHRVSRPWREVVDEAAEMAASGVQEIVITGVCVGAYGPDTGSEGPDLAELLRRIADIDGIPRLRLSSIQPIEVGDSLIDAFATRPALCPHLHLSCQSGDDTVLAAMNRPYDTAFYEALVARLRAAIPDVAITTDLIVGYPGETRAQHENTLAFACRVGFQKTHVFRYSPRERTHAATLPDDVPDDEKRRRHDELQALVDASHRAFAARFVGRTLPVVVEGSGGEGHTAHYVRVRFDAPAGLIGRTVPVRLEAVDDDGVARGTLLGEHRPAPSPAFVPLAIAP